MKDPCNGFMDHDKLESMLGVKLPDCLCATCIELSQPVGGLILGQMMVLCVKCGNKRCPHATDHRYECTNSNASGQAGSRYA